MRTLEDTHRGNTEYPIRVAQVIGKLNAGGVEAVMNNYYRCIDRSRYQFDFIIDSDGAGHPRDDLIKLGARYFVVPPYQRLFRHMAALIRLFREQRYTIVHAGMNSLSVFSLCAAWLAGVPVRINHNHSTSSPGERGRTLFKMLLRPFARVFATHCCACSKAAGEWLFGKRRFASGAVTVLHNAIDTERFRFDPSTRTELRERYGLQDCFVVGHVGRYCYTKNQPFVLELFAALHKEQPDTRLLLIGTGTTDAALKEKAAQLGIQHSVLFLGAREDVDRLYQAMDAFVFPSHYEGLGLAAVEAQCAGLPVIASTGVPEEARVTDRIQYLPLERGADAWAAEIKRLREQEHDRAVSISAEYDIRKEAKKLETYYDRALNETGISRL